MGTTQELLGGVGSCRWKQLVNGMHLNGPWNCVEYVVIPPGCSCGEHTHMHTEEIYYILSGAAEMTLNGAPVPLRAGDLVTAPIGTSHGTRNPTDEDMEFLVVEVYPGVGESPAPVLIRVGDGEPGSTSEDAAPGAVEDTADLSRLFTGPWRTFSTIDLTPGERLERDVIEDGDEVLMVAGGTATIEFGSELASGGFGLCVGVPPGQTRALANSSPDEPLRVLSTIVGLG
jgi:mannose-6-phosphate isomerase-like protein (cupin superfamily)